jgi:uncharacterized ferritin-like protein (DUF455 family)
MPDSAPNVRAFCLRLLDSGDLETKLVRPRDEDGAPLSDASPGPAIHIERPARDAGLRMAGGASRLPRPGQLISPEARALCLARFAHHELMAAELFAWALLRWPELPAALRRGWLGVLEEEQLHCSLYLERLEATGHRLDEYEHSDYFWRHAPSIAASPHGPRAFLAAMGLTLEQANLDFAGLYRDAFREAGDETSARVCERVHRDEIGHVSLAREWLLTLDESTDDEIAAYERAVPFPLAASRAKGRRFDAESRRRAGLGEAFIEHVRQARSTQQTGRPPAAPDAAMSGNAERGDAVHGDAKRGNAAGSPSQDAAEERE